MFLPILHIQCVLTELLTHGCQGEMVKHPPIRGRCAEVVSFQETHNIETKCSLRAITIELYPGDNSLSYTEQPRSAKSALSKSLCFTFYSFKATKLFLFCFIRITQYHWIQVFVFCQYKGEIFFDFYQKVVYHGTLTL